MKPVFVILFLAASVAFAETTNSLSEAEIQGRQLAQQYLQQKPAANTVQTGVLKIRDGKGKTINVSLKCEIVVTETNWASIYETVVTNADGYTDGNYLKIVHADSEPGKYTWNNFHSPKISSLRSNLGEVKW